MNKRILFAPHRLALSQAKKVAVIGIVPGIALFSIDGMHDDAENR